MPEAPEAASPAVLLLELGHRARLAASLPELEFLLVNDTRLLAPYRQAALWREAGGVAALSGVVQPDRNAPYAQWLARACAPARADGDTARAVSAADLPDELGAQWREWLPPQGVWLPLRMLEEPDAAGRRRSRRADAAAAADRVEPHLVPCMAGLAARPALVLGRLAQPRPLAARRGAAGAAPACGPPAGGWRDSGAPVGAGAGRTGRRATRRAARAAGRRGRADPRAAQPDREAGPAPVQPDEAQIASRLQVAQQALSTAEAEYRQFAQMALGDPRSRRSWRRWPARSASAGPSRPSAEQLGRASVTAPRDGMVLFDSPSEWIGKPVQTGERVMRVADPDAVEIEAWVPVGDAIPLAEGAPLRLYLAADPLTAVQGRVRYMAYDAVARPDGSYAYRLRASLDQAQGPRIGLKGTAKLQGERVPLAYWILRKPWAAIRQFVAL